MRLTAHRKEILALLQNTPHGLSAADIHASLPHIDLVTIYRSLERFTAEQLITKLHLGTNEATFEYQSKPHFHAVCNDCNRVVHFTLKTETLKKQFAIPNFDIKKIDIVLHGVCTTVHSTPSSKKATKHLH